MSTRRIPTGFRIGLALAAASVSGLALAQIGGDRGAAPVDSSSSFEVSGVTVDVRGKDAETARQWGWRIAQRKGWEMLSQRLAHKNVSLSDSAIDALVTGIVIEREEVGPNRYIARLGVLFDRGRAGAILGVSTAIRRSPPMLVIPIEWSGGAGRGFERTTAWQEAWARFRTGSSTIDYIRPRGTGPAPLLLNAGQIGRRGRGWWRSTLDQYGAADVLIPEVLLRREYPGGPVVAIFTASHGPDRQLITQFALRVDNGDALDTLLDTGVQRIDRAYQEALASGLLRTDRLLAYRAPAEKAEEEGEDETQTTDETPVTTTETPVATPAATGATYSLQVETPSASAVTQSESAVRGVPGVRSSVTTSLAIGGTSVMRVTYDGPIASLRSALEARGWQVQEGPGVLRIRRAGSNAPAPAPTQPADSSGE